MEQVIGIGTDFFRARDPEGLPAGYKVNLGIQPEDEHSDFVVPDLDRMPQQLGKNRVKVEKGEDYDCGRFAWITDPEGNRIELWEPLGEFKG